MASFFDPNPNLTTMGVAGSPGDPYWLWKSMKDAGLQATGGERIGDYDLSGPDSPNRGDGSFGVIGLYNPTQLGGLSFGTSGTPQDIRLWQNWMRDYSSEVTQKNRRQAAAAIAALATAGVLANGGFGLSGTGSASTGGVGAVPAGGTTTLSGTMPAAAASGGTGWTGGQAWFANLGASTSSAGAYAGLPEVIAYGSRVAAPSLWRQMAVAGGTAALAANAASGAGRPLTPEMQQALPPINTTPNQPQTQGFFGKVGSFLTSGAGMNALNWANLGLSVFSGYQQYQAQKDAARAQNEIIELRNIRQRRQFMADVRTARANALLQQIGSGAELTSSGYQGVKGSIRSQTTRAENYMQNMRRLGGDVAMYQEQAARYGLYSQIGQVASNIASAYQPTIRQK